MRRGRRALRHYDVVVALAISMAISGFVAGSPAEAGDAPDVRKIADTNTEVPGGGGGSFTAFDGAPVIENSIVAFRGENTDLFEMGIYYGNNQASLQVLVDRNTELPGFSETFDQIAGLNNGGGPSIDRGHVVFRGQTNVFTPTLFVTNGLYIARLFSEDLEIVVENTFDPPVTPPLGPDAAFVDFYFPSFRRGEVAYRGDTVENDVRRSGIFLTPEDTTTPTLIFDPSDALCPQQLGDSVSLNEPSLTRGEIVFAAYCSANGGFERRWGVYREEDGTFTTEVIGSPDETPPPPVGSFTRIGGATTTFLGRPIAHGDGVLFYAGRVGASDGLFFSDGVGAPDEVAALGTSIPNGGGATFTSFPRSNWALQGGRVLFVGKGTGVVGIYQWTPGGGLVEWLSNKSSGNLDGRPADRLTGLKIGPEGLDGVFVAFTAFFADGSIAIYRTGPKAGQTAAAPLIPFTTDDASRFVFPNADVVRDALLFFDPEVAIGYDFEVESGPGVTLLALPLDIGDGVYEIWVWDGEMYVLDGTTVEEGEFAIHSFASATTKFRILGVEPSAGLDAEDPLAFPAGLVFADDGQVDVSMTILLPEPGTALMAGAALACLTSLAARRRRGQRD